tara:strand:+ start:92 stop:319 length:228 start_codon:yes stop_codon:yes gene_type:complete
VEGNDSLYTYAIGNTSNNERVSGEWSLCDSVLTGNHVSLIGLDTLAFAFNNAKVHGNGVTGLEILDVVQSLSLDQ